MNEKTPLKIQKTTGTYYKVTIDGLGDITFIFDKHNITPDPINEYSIEAYWNPDNYGRMNYLGPWFCKTIEKGIEHIESKMDYYLEKIKQSCIYNIEDGSDVDGEYKKILNSYFHSVVIRRKNKQLKEKKII